MQNKKNQSAKVNTVKTSNNVEVSKVNLSKINLSKFAEKFANVSEKIVSNQRESIYKYAVEFTKEKINGLEGKQLRNKHKRNIQNFASRMFVACKHKNESEIINIKNEFISYYKENYILNDYSLKSISNSQDKSKTDNIVNLLEVIKELNPIA